MRGFDRRNGGVRESYRREPRQDAKGGDMASELSARKKGVGRSDRNIEFRMLEFRLFCIPYTTLKLLLFEVVYLSDDVGKELGEDSRRKARSPGVFNSARVPHPATTIATRVATRCDRMAERIGVVHARRIRNH